jgi:hypothetical protein
MLLQKIIDEIRVYPGITRKRDISVIIRELESVRNYGRTIASFGEDAAVIEHQGEYLLLAADGIWSGLIEANPYAAGKASVMASVNDIYAMGGRPLAMVNVIGVPDSGFYADILRGIHKGCEKFRVPMVGGHLHPDTRQLELSVAILGVARRLLLSSNAAPGQDIIFAVDLAGRGYQCKPVLSWDTNSGKDSAQVLARLEVLPQLAERELCGSAKDVSNGGLLGTIALFMESSGTGARVALDRIPKPDEFQLADWLKAFLSYGFVLCADRPRSAGIIQEFSRNGITATLIGEVIPERKILLTYGPESGTLFDLAREHIAGISRERA